MAFTSRIPCTRPVLNAKQKRKRFQFARSYSQWTEDDWRNVVFSDESKFMIGLGKQGPRVWRQAHERHQPSCLKRCLSSIQLLCSFGDVCVQCACGVGNLCFITAGTMLNAAVYVEIVDTDLI